MSNFLRVALLALSFFVLECSGNTKICSRYSQDTRVNYHLKIGPGFTYLQTLLIEAGVAEWKRALHPVFSYDVEQVSLTKQEVLSWSQNEKALSMANDEIFIFEGFDAENKEDPRRIGYFTSQNTVYIIQIINDRLTDSDLVTYRSIVEHELGHAFGLEHSESKYHSIMTEFVNQSSDCVTQEDINNVCSNWCCDPSVLHPCVNKSIDNSSSFSASP